MNLATSTTAQTLGNGNVPGAQVPNLKAWHDLQHQISTSPYDDSEDPLYVYADPNTLITPPAIVRRFNGSGERYYYTVDENGLTANFYVSTTTFIRRSLPTSEHLMTWMKKHGDAADRMRDEAAAYGSLMHIAYAEFHRSGWEFDRTKDWIMGSNGSIHLSRETINAWTTRLNKDVLSYAQFCYDYQIEPVLIEGMLCSDELGVGGTVDLIAWATLGKGRFEKRILIQVDFKSGGIHQSAEAQLVINQMIFEENFPHLEIQGLFSFSPKDWLKTPTYTLKCQDDTRFKPATIEAMKVIYDTLHGGQISNKTFHNFNGKLTAGADPLQHHKWVNATDIVLK